MMFKNVRLWFVGILSVGILQHTAAQRLVIVSDTQKPLWIETLQVKADSNEEATQRILNTIVSDTTADALVHLGDMTALTGLNSAWSLIDAVLDKIHVPILYVRGNHDYLPIRSWADDKIAERLGASAGKRRVWRLKEMAVVLFDSNEGRFSDEENEEQAAWFDSTLTALDNDTSIRWVIAGCHHSPYTNSTIVSPSEYVQQNYVPSFARHQKTTLFIGGHAHAYERFEEDGKTFLVLGGGGGLRQPLLLGTEQRWIDHAPMKTELRMFHYGTIDVVPEGLLFRVHMLKADRTGFEIGEEVLRPEPVKQPSKEPGT